MATLAELKDGAVKLYGRGDALAALRCYDAVRPHRLPPELANKNPTGKMWRLVDGNWSQGDVAG